MVIAVVFIAAALAFGSALLVQGVDMMTAGSPLPGGIRTAGTVVSVDKHCPRGCTYTPTISFTAAGHTYLFSGVVRDSKPAVGSTVAVSYEPADPQNAHDLGSSAGRWIINMVFGGLFILAGLWLAYIIATGPRRRRRNQAASSASGAPSWDPTWDESLRDEPRDGDPCVTGR